MTDATPAGRGRRAINAALTAAIVVNAALLGAAAGWVYLDGGSHAVISSRRGWEGAFDGPTGWLDGAAAVAAATLALAFAGLVVGPPRLRSLRAWALLVTIAAGWLALAVNWQRVHWQGQQHRVAADFAGAEAVVQSLRDNWPTTDGETDSLGGFLAYPKGAPRTLMLMSRVRLPGSDLRIASIERTPDGAIALELTGPEYGAWIEWRENDDPPAPYTSGLDTAYTPGRAVRLAPRWYLVRYSAE